MPFPILAIVVAIIAVIVGHPAIVVARRAENDETRRLAGHLALATLCIVSSATLLMLLQPEGSWLVPAVALCSLAIGATFDASRQNGEVHL
jgi:uncharacterized membrane protein YoaK (UPF0700 family)